MLYLLDANVLITAHNTYYSIEQVPEFWDWLRHLFPLIRQIVASLLHSRAEIPSIEEKERKMAEESKGGGWGFGTKEATQTSWEAEGARVRAAITEFEGLAQPAPGKNELTRAIYQTSATTNLILWHILQENKQRDAKLATLSEQLKSIQQEVAKVSNLSEQLGSIRAELAPLSSLSEQIEAIQLNTKSLLGQYELETFAEVFDHMNDMLTDTRNFTRKLAHGPGSDD